MVYKCKENNEKPRKSLHLHRQKRRKRIYIAKAGQISLFEEPANFIGAKLNPENRWVQMAAMIPWFCCVRNTRNSFKTRKPEIRQKRRGGRLVPISSRRSLSFPMKKQSSISKKARICNGFKGCRDFQT